MQSLGPLPPGNVVELQLNLLPLAAGLQVSLLLTTSTSSFSLEGGKTKSDVISLINHNRRKQRNEPIRIGSKYMQPAPSAGTLMLVTQDWFGLASHWLRKWRELYQPIIQYSRIKTKQRLNYFRDPIENRSADFTATFRIDAPSLK